MNHRKHEKLRVSLMLGQRRRRWSTIKQTLGQRLVFAGLQICTRVTNAVYMA